MLQGLGCCLVFGKETPLAVIDTSLARVFAGALEKSQIMCGGAAAVKPSVAEEAVSRQPSL